jgi:hypothetical protein
VTLAQIPEQELTMLIGDRVNRLEDRETVGATVIEVDADNVLLEYDEGGQGWWPSESVVPI